MAQLEQHSFKIKWVGPNEPGIIIDGNTTVVSKRDVIAMLKELREFVSYYDEEFSVENINKPLSDIEINDDDH